MANDLKLGLSECIAWAHVLSYGDFRVSCQQDQNPAARMASDDVVGSCAIMMTRLESIGR